jgi:hypothetical protein
MSALISLTALPAHSASDGSESARQEIAKC